MRKLTEPGVAPPAPGSVSPSPPIPGVRPPVPERKGTPAGAHAYTPEDDIPTKPDGQQQLAPELLKLVRIVDSMPTVERRRFIALAESYQKCGLGPRVLIEELARELAVRE